MGKKKKKVCEKDKRSWGEQNRTHSAESLPPHRLRWRGASANKSTSSLLLFLFWLCRLIFPLVRPIRIQIPSLVLLLLLGLKEKNVLVFIFLLPCLNIIISSVCVWLCLPSCLPVWVFFLFLFFSRALAVLVISYLPSFPSLSPFTPRYANAANVPFSPFDTQLYSACVFFYVITCAISSTG